MSNAWKGAYALVLVWLALHELQHLPSFPLAVHAAHHHARHETLRFFWQDKLNFTDFFILPGLPGVGSAIFTTISVPYGSVFVFVDPLTETPDPASKQIGTARGTFTGASFDGIIVYSAFTFEFNTTKRKGTLSFLGSYPTTVAATIPIVGGTGDFLFAQGYSVFTPVNTSTFNVTYGVDLRVYWPASGIY